MPFPPHAPKLIHQRVEAGLLLLDAPTNMYAGYGTGGPCAGCDERITPAQVEYEFEDAAGRTIRFHLGCAGLWEAERQLRGYVSPRARSDAA